MIALQNKSFLNDIANQFSLGDTSVTEFLINIFLTIILAYILGLVYSKYGSSLSNRKKLKQTFVLMAITPALENPTMVLPSEAEYLGENDLIVGYVHNGEARAYPHRIFDWHEIINDNINGREVAITHCPLTMTSIGWERTYQGKTTTFGVSGLLYNTNLMPYDRATNSTWTQQGLKCVNGELIETEVETFPVFETTWDTWKKMYPDTKVVSDRTGFSRNYGRYPYGDYRTNNDFLLFSVSVNDTRLPQKERVHGVIVGEKVKVYQFKNFETDAILLDTFEGKNVVVVGSIDKNYIVSFYEKTIGGQVLEFSLDTDISVSLMTDQLGNKWDAFGIAVSGPNEGETLEATRSFIGMWFSWAPFYPNPVIFE